MGEPAGRISTQDHRCPGTFSRRASQARAPKEDFRSLTGRQQLRNGSVLDLKLKRIIAFAAEKKHVLAKLNGRGQQMALTAGGYSPKYQCLKAETSFPEGRIVHSSVTM
jgi:hypothetical protein